MSTNPLSNAIITQYFGENPEDYQVYGYPGHNGQDLTTYESPPIVHAFLPGRCLKVGWEERGYGKYIVLDHGGRESWYCHLEEVYIKPGENVEEGEPIAKMGSTGNSTGPHLHFGLKASDGDGAPGYKGFMDPQQLLEQSNQPENSTIYVLKQPTQPSFKSISVTKPKKRGKVTWYPRTKQF